MIHINTAVVSAAADQIEEINQKNQDTILEVDAMIRTLQSCWEGEAANCGIDQYYRIKQSFSGVWSSALENLVFYMRNQVVQDYEETESTIKNSLTQN